MKPASPSTILPEQNKWWILTLVPCHSEREMEIGNEKTGNGNDDGCEEEEVTLCIETGNGKRETGMGITTQVVSCKTGL